MCMFMTKHGPVLVGTSGVLIIFGKNKISIDAIY